MSKLHGCTHVMLCYTYNKAELQSLTENTRMSLSC